jgi:hypothetical protein
VLAIGALGLAATKHRLTTLKTLWRTDFSHSLLENFKREKCRIEPAGPKFLVHVYTSPTALQLPSEDVEGWVRSFATDGLSIER